MKIDRTFIHDAGEDPQDRAIVRAIVTLARSLDLEIIAEGVETKAQWDFINELTCERAQGYLFSRPVPPNELLDLADGGGGIFGQRSLSRVLPSFVVCAAMY